MAAAAPDPNVEADVEQIERYEFRVSFPGSSGILDVDEDPPVGSGRGPNPVRVLAAAVGHCMSSTLFNTLERAHVPATPVHTQVTTDVGRNAAGRLRVLRMAVRIFAAPVHEEDRGRFDRCVSVFEDYCTVSGAVREGVRIETEVRRP